MSVQSSKFQSSISQEQLILHSIPKPKNPEQEKLALIALCFFKENPSVALRHIQELDQETRNTLHEFYWAVSQKPDVPFFGLMIETESTDSLEEKGESAKRMLSFLQLDCTKVFSLEFFLSKLSFRDFRNLISTSQDMREKVSDLSIFENFQLIHPVYLFIIQEQSSANVFTYDLLDKDLKELSTLIRSFQTHVWSRSQTLELDYVRLPSITGEFGPLSNLKTLAISGKQLSLIPPLHGALRYLQSFDLSYNQLLCLSPEFGTLSHLQSLILSHNQLNALPTEFSALRNLHTLDLSHNQFTSFPNKICELNYLRYLNLSNNQLSSLDPKFSVLTNLKTLHLQTNRFSACPPELSTMQMLQHLNLSNNQISSLDPGFGALEKLQTLNFAHNQFSSLPPELCSLKNLRYLNLSHNKLSFLHPEFSGLTNLKALHLQENEFSFDPPELTQIKNLRDLRLSTH